MPTIEIFDPALCCSTGVCGVEVDQQLVNAAADVDWARQSGAQITRFNLAQQPMAFADNAQVKAMLQRSGQEALPLTLVDGEVALAGRYPTRAQLARWAGVAEPVPEAPAAGACCTPAKAATPEAGSGCCTPAQTTPDAAATSGCCTPGKAASGVADSSGCAPAEATAGCCGGSTGSSSRCCC